MFSVGLAGGLQAQPPFGDALANLARLKPFEGRRASSSDPNWQNGNADARPIAPGGTLTLAELEGPGVITLSGAAAVPEPGAAAPPLVLAHRSVP